MNRFAHVIRFATLALVAAVGCSSDPARPYTGTWSFASGSDNVSCPNGTTATALQGNVTIKPASNGGLLVLDPEGCNFTYGFDGSRASASAQNVLVRRPRARRRRHRRRHLRHHQLATDDGKTMDDTFSGTVVYTSSAGALDCIFSGTATLTKVSDE